VVFFLAFLFVTTVLKLSKEWFHLLESKRKLAQIEKEKVEAEMKMLKSHLDPHFLFNSLNVIYSLARKNHENTSDAVIQLSDIMRFITYDAKEKTIEISDEVTLIEKYIALQNYRLEKEALVEFEKQIGQNVEIAPLLLLPLVENAYKHGIKGNIRNGWIKILLRTETNNIKFEITNSIGEDQVQHGSEKGSGLNNIRQRLELIYPGNHTFEIAKEKDKFKVHLSIEV
jgi:LytS/YehU family sensor histidine kinase